MINLFGCIENGIEIEGDEIYNIIINTPLDEYELRIGKRFMDMSREEMSLYHVWEFNDKQGTQHLRDGIHCAKCNNKGFYDLFVNGDVESVLCECFESRDSKRLLIAQGLDRQLKHCVFDNYNAVLDWQKLVEKKARAFVLKNENKWFFIGGQPGSGKTHICLSIINELFNKLVPCGYINWESFIDEITAVQFKAEEYMRMMNTARQAKVLYIDDFLKPFNGEMAKRSELKRAFEIIDYRYANNLTTIISGELSQYEVSNLDEAIGTRILEKAKDYALNIKADVAKNYRIKI